MLISISRVINPIGFINPLLIVRGNCRSSRCLEGAVDGLFAAAGRCPRFRHELPQRNRGDVAPNFYPAAIGVWPLVMPV
jgi:hypothetical protein